MRYNRIIFMMLLICMNCNVIMAQTGFLKGIVVDAETESVLSGVEIADASGKVIAVTDAAGLFSVEMDEGKYVIFINMTDYDQFTVVADIKRGESFDLGTIRLNPAVMVQDIPIININEDVSDDGFESQAIQGILSSTADVFLSNAAYTFGAVMFRVRGYDANYTNVSLNGFVVNDVESGSPYYSNWGGLNDVMRNAMVTSGPEPVGFLFEPVGGVTRVNTRASEYRAGTKIVYSLSNRSYANRAMITCSTGLMDNNWAFTGSYSKRWGEHGYKEGTFYNANSLFFAAEKKFNSRHSLNITALDAIYSRGVGGSTTQEVYDMMGDNYYNPYWGYQNGEVRNSRVRSNNKPLVTVAHFWDPSEKLNISTTIGYWFGKSGYTALNWYDSEDPRPDYYKKLPSYYSDPSDIERVTEAWQTDPTVSHINWDNLYFANRKNLYTVFNANGTEGNSITGNRSKYIVEDRRNDISQFQFNTRADWNLNEHIDILGGVLVDIYRGHNFNVVSDLLGGNYWIDIDQYAERDYPDNPDALQNNLDNPNRTVKKGDVFGNNYYAFQRSSTLWSTVRYNSNKYSVYVSADARYTAMWREGLFRKGLFPENSLGNSEKLDFLTWGIKAGGDWRITGRHLITLNTQIATDPPLFKNSFLSPRTRNSVTPNIQEETIFSADLSYILRAPSANVRLTGYYTRFMNQTKVTAFYHDDWRTLVNYAMTDIDKENTGLELGAEVTLFTGFNINSAISIGQYVWLNNPEITITRDNNAEVLSTEDVWVQYFRQSGIPQTAVSLGFEYNAPKFWWIGVTGSYYDNVYLDYNPVTRTKDDTGYYPYWEQQIEAKPGFLLDAFVGKSWRINYKYYISVSANLSNLLNKRTFITGGYEQYRFDEKHPERFDPKVFYYSGFNYFVNVSFRF